MGAPRSETLPKTGERISLILDLLLTSLALSPIKSYPNCFAHKYAMVVFPMPGGPTNKRGFVPFFHLVNHSTIADLDSSLPTISEIL